MQDASQLPGQSKTRSLHAIVCAILFCDQEVVNIFTRLI